MSDDSKTMEREAVRDVASAYQILPLDMTAEDVPPAHKRTEVGLIPYDWHVKRLGDVAHIKTGDRDNQDKVDNGKYPFFVRSDHVERIDTYSYNCEAIIVPGEGRIEDIFHYIDGPFELHQRVYKISHFPPDTFGRYVYFAMAYQFGRHALRNTVKAAVDSLRLPTFKNFIFPSPNRWQEQCAIATALSGAGALIESLDRLIAKKRAIKQATMQQLLSGAIRLPGFEREWHWRKLDEVGEIMGSGVDKKSHPDEQPVRLLNYLDVFHRDFLYSDHLHHWVTAPSAKVERCTIKRGDIFFTPSSETRSDIGLSAVSMEDIPDAAFSYHVVRFRLKESWDLRFRAYAFKSREFLRQAEKECDGGGTRYVISLPKFRAMLVLLPPLDEQRAVASVLSDMDSEIEALERRRDKARKIKQGMMQELLTGRTRLVEREAASAEEATT